VLSLISESTMKWFYAQGLAGSEVRQRGGRGTLVGEPRGTKTPQESNENYACSTAKRIRSRGQVKSLKVFYLDDAAPRSGGSKSSGQWECQLTFPAASVGKPLSTNSYKISSEPARVTFNAFRRAEPTSLYRSCSIQLPFLALNIMVKSV